MGVCTAALKVSENFLLDFHQIAGLMTLIF